MNLLDATTHVVDAAKSSPAGERPPLSTAIKRLEKRIQLLRLRATKARRRCRHRAFWHAMKSYAGGISRLPRNKTDTSPHALEPCVVGFCCPQCKGFIHFGLFMKSAEITGHGRLRVLDCPHCDHDLTKKMRYDLILPGEL